jgi:hypothetical protein
MLRHQVRDISFAAVCGLLVGCSGSVTELQLGGGMGGDGGNGGATDDGGKGGLSTPDPTLVGASFACNKDASPGEVRMRHLTKVQYTNTVADLLRFALGDAAAATSALTSIASALATVPSETRALVPKSPIHGTFRRANQDIAQEHAEGYYAVSVAVAAALTSPTNVPKLLGSCSSQTNVSACVDGFIEKFGQRALRRPLETAEKTAFRAIYGTGTALDPAALADTITVILNNPAFLFQTEHGSDGSGAKNSFALTSFELASRLSYHFWQTMPDELLWQAAVSGKLATDEGYQGEVNRLFRDARATSTMDSFFDEWFQLENVKVINANSSSPAEKKFVGSTALTASLSQNMRNEVVDLTRHLVFVVGASMRDLLTTDLSFAKTDDLRSIYGVTGSAPIRLPAEKRPGIFTRAAFLANGSVRTRPVMKGVFLRTELLCDELPSPPANAVNAKLEGDISQLTTRAQIEALTEVKGSACASCHKELINPLGFITENFDALGRERSEEKFFDQKGEQIGSQPINTGTTTAVTSDERSAISNVSELMTRIADSGKAEACMARQYFRFAFARWENEDKDGCTLEELRTAASKGPIKDMLQRIAMSPAFKRRTFE